MKILVMLSGGLDSAVVLAARFGVPFRRLKIAPAIPLVDEVVFAARNLILAAHAIAHAQATHFDAIAVGCNSTDWDRFRDCRPPFWKAVETAAEAYGIKVLTPLLHSYKAEIMAHARKLDLPTTWSCYAPTADSRVCGQCLACVVNREAEQCLTDA